MLSFHESVKMFDWAVDGQLHEYEVSEPATIAFEACCYLKNSQKPVLVAQPFAKGVMYMIFSDIPYRDGISGREAPSEPKMRAVVFEIVDRRFGNRFVSRTTRRWDSWDREHNRAILGAPTDSHGSIFLRRIGRCSDMDDHPGNPIERGSRDSIIITFNIFTRSFQRVGERGGWPYSRWDSMKPHFWDGLCAKVYTRSPIRGGSKSRVLPRVSVLHITPIRRTLSEEREHEAWMDAHIRTTVDTYLSEFLAPIRCFPQLSAETKELSAAVTTSASLGLDDGSWTGIDIPYGSLYAIISDPEFHSYDTIGSVWHYRGSASAEEDGSGVTIFGDDDFLITIGGAGYSAWCFAPAGDAPKEAENAEK